MAQALLQKILDCEIKTEDLLDWLIATKVKEKSLDELSILCTQKDFVTYFLNILHSQLLCERSVETPQKPKVSHTLSFNRSKLQKKNLFVDSRLNNDESVSNNLDESSQSFNCSSSTPKSSKSFSYGNMEESFSPIHHKSHNSFKKDSDNNTRNSSVCLGDYIVFTKKSSNSSNNAKRRSNNKSSNLTPKRINPTKINETRKTNEFTCSDNSFNFEQNKDNNLLNNGEITRDVLKKEIEIFNTKRNSIDENNILEQNKSSEIKLDSGNNVEISPNPKKVTFREKLIKIANIYRNLLENNLILNIVGELYFVISLLFNKICYSETINKVLNQSNSKDNNFVTFDELFKSVHNVIFFACYTLEIFDSTLMTLDRLTLKYMSENLRLRLFSPNLAKKLENYYENKQEKQINVYNSLEKRNVCFVLDTDNRGNFPSDVSFQSFKKQRDLFYEILKIWEDEHMRQDWNFQVVLGRKIKLLLDYHNDPFNYMRLSRLFMEQLLSVCGKNTKEKNSKETNCSILTSLPKIDKDKFDRLKNRLVTKQSSEGINTGPDFPGYQEFYKEFILSSSNPNFFRHLCDNFISEILELSTTSFSNIDSESSDNETDQDTKKAFVECLKSLTILGKFLGFVESLPYKNNDSVSCPSNLLDIQIKIRDQVKPRFDVLELLKDSTQKGTLTLFIPWLCVYFSMLDQITLKTRYYMKIIEDLMNLYKNFEKSRSSIPKYNACLVKYTLGWFFELSNIPQSFFFEKVNNMPFCLNIEKEAKVVKCLDELEIVDHNILYIFCPFLDEIKKLLASKIVIRDRVTIRHITPLTAVESPEEIARKKIENQLEEAFFNGHPASLRKTVDFVAERIASTCVKYLCYKLIPDFKKEFVKDLQTKICEGFIDVENLNILRKRCDKMAEERFKTLEILWVKEVDEIIEKNLKIAIRSLLPIDCLTQVESICVNVAKKICLEKVKQWSSTHIVLNILTKDVASEIAKYVDEDLQKSKHAKHAFALPPGGKQNMLHDENVKSAVFVLDKLRDMSVELLSTAKDLEEAELKEFLFAVKETLTKRNDVNEAIHFVITSQLVDFSLLIITFQPSVFVKIQEIFIEICKLKKDRSEELFSNLICQRNITILEQAGPAGVRGSWKEFAQFCALILKEQLLTCESFESQCTGIFKNELNDEILKNITSFMRDFVEIYKKDRDSSKFTFLLEFLSDYCSDL